jgi:hypothetical protein
MIDLGKFDHDLTVLPSAAKHGLFAEIIPKWLQESG